MAQGEEKHNPFLAAQGIISRPGQFPRSGMCHFCPTECGNNQSQQKILVTNVFASNTNKEEKKRAYFVSSAIEFLPRVSWTAEHAQFQRVEEEVEETAKRKTAQP